MKKVNGLIIVFIVVFIGIGWFSYQKNTDDTYKGMSIIPEQSKDIPLYDGIKPTNHYYVIDGNYSMDIYKFYLEELPMLGWKVEYEDLILIDKDMENGFRSRWRKDGFDGVLWITAYYNQLEEQTKVIFDKTPVYNSTIWIDNIPESIYIYQSPTDEKYTELKDVAKIEEIIRFINDAIDWDKEILPHDKTSVIDFGNINIKVLYENDKEIYFQSEKGTKLMMPDPDFFILTTLSQ